MRRATRGWVGGALWTTGSSAVIGVLGLVAVAAAGRSLGAGAYGDFAFTWALFFGVGGVFAGLQSEVTRTLSTEDRAGEGPPLLVTSLLLAGPVSLVGGLIAATSGGATASASIGPVITVGLMMLAALTFSAGVLAAEHQWRHLAGLMTIDAGLRTLAVVLVAAAGAAQMLPVAIAAGAVAWIFLLPSPRQRASLGAALALRRVGFARRAVWAMAAAGCTSIAVNGLPALVTLVRPGSFDASVAGELAALVFIRSGLLLGVYGLRPVILRYFLSTPVTQRLLRTAVVCCVVGGVAYALLVALVGPWLLPLLLGPGFVLSPLTGAWLAVGSAGLVLMVVVGLALLAQDQHVAAAYGWAGALVAAVVLVAAAPTTASAIVLAAAISPWVGALLHLTAAVPTASRIGQQAL